MRDLQNRSGTYYLHKRVPTDLLDQYPSSIIRKSLRTKDPREARERRDLELAKLQVTWRSMRNGAQPESIESLVQELDRLYGLLQDAQNNVLPPQGGNKQKFIDKLLGLQERTNYDAAVDLVTIRVEKLLEEYHRLEDAPDSTPDAIQKAAKAYREAETTTNRIIDSHNAHINPESANVAPNSNKKSCTIAELRDAYLEYLKQKENPKGTVNNFNGAVKRLCAYFSESRPADSLARSEVRAFRGFYASLPVNYPKSLPAHLRDTPFADVPQLAQSLGLRLISHARVNSVFDLITAMFNYGVREQLIENNRFNNLKKLPSKPTQKREEKPYSESQLIQLFNHFEKESWHYWLSLFGIYQGRRLNALLELRKSDFALDKGVLTMNIRIDKNNASKGIVPVHPILQRLGLESKIDNLQENGLLFEGFPVGSNGKRSDNCSKKFKRSLKGSPLESKPRPFHSFRHTFADQCRACELPRAEWQHIGGWDTDKNIADLYGSSSYVHLEKHLAKLSYPELERQVLLSDSSNT